MLTIADFTFPVRQLESGSKLYWEYLGISYPEFQVFVAQILDAGESCLIPGVGVTRFHLEKMTHAKCKLLAAMVQVQGPEDKWLKYPGEIPRVSEKEARGFTTSYNYLAHFGLAESQPSTHKRHGVKWRATTAGRAFIHDNTSCPDYVVNQGKEVLRRSEMQVYLSDFYDAEAIDDLRNTPGFWLPKESSLASLDPVENDTLDVNLLEEDV